MKETQSLWKTWATVAAFLCAGQALQAQSQPVQPVKIVHLQLESLGWQSPPKMHRGEMDLNPSHLIAIDHKNRVIVGFVIQENVKDLAAKSHPGFMFRILRFTREGTVDLSLALPTNNWHDNGVYLDESDDILARADDVLQMLPSKYEKGDRHLDWQSLAACGPRCVIEQSFSRGTLVLLNLDSDPPVSILQESPPRVVKRCQRTQSGFDRYSQRFTDAFAYWITGGAWPAPLPVIDRWPLCDYEKKTQMQVPSGEFGAIFPLNDRLAVVSGSKRLQQKEKSERVIGVISTDGSAKFIVQLPKRDQPETWVQGDENGDRFAVSIATWHGGSRWLDISGNRVARRIVVYNAVIGKELASFASTPHALIDLAMSPDGHRVAVMANDIVTIADIP